TPSDHSTDTRSHEQAGNAGDLDPHAARNHGDREDAAADGPGPASNGTVDGFPAFHLQACETLAERSPGRSFPNTRHGEERKRPPGNGLRCVHSMTVPNDRSDPGQDPHHGPELASYTD